MSWLAIVILVIVVLLFAAAMTAVLCWAFFGGVLKGISAIINVNKNDNDGGAQ